MKKISNSIFFLMLFSLLFFSCEEEEDYRDMNITYLKEEIDLKEFTDGLTSQIVVKNKNNEEIDNIDMCESFYIFDNTYDGVDQSLWTITQGDESETLEGKFNRISFSKSGEATISLTSTRSSDKKSITSEVTIDVNLIAVEAGFINSPLADEGTGKITIKKGESIDFTSVSSGCPDEFQWLFDGPTQFTATEETPTIQFTEAGLFDAKLTALRSDGERAVDERAGYIEVEEVDMRLLRAIATDDKIVLRFGYDVQANLEEIKEAISLKIKTNANTELTPKVLSIAAVEGDPTSVSIVMDNKMYSDDQLLVSIPAGSFTDKWGLTQVPEIIDLPATYGHNLWDNELYGMEAGADTWKTIDKAEVAITDEKAFTGKYSLMLHSQPGAEWTDAEVVGEGRTAQLDEDKTYTLTWKQWIDPDHYHNVLGPWLRWDGGAAQKQFWTGMNNLTKGEWITITKTVKGSDISGDRAVHFHVRVKFDCLIYIDDLAIYEPNPRP